MKISDVAVHHRTTVFTMVVVVVLVGVFSYVSLPREAAPDVQIPIITVTTTYRGVAPQDMENLVTIPVEKKLKGLDDLDEIRSTTMEGRSTIYVMFLTGVDMDVARQKVRDKVEEAKGDIPEDADEPILGEINVSEFPIMSIALYAVQTVDRLADSSRRLSEALGRLPGLDVEPLRELAKDCEDISDRIGEMSLVRLKKLAEDIEERLTPIQGVLNVTVIGGREREILILYDPIRLASYRFPMTDLLELVRRENVNVSGGKMDSDRTGYQVRVEGEFVDPSKIQGLVIGFRDDKPIYLTDVARIVDGFEDRTQYSRFRGRRDKTGRENVTILVQKRAGQNIVFIADKVKQVLAEATDVWRQGIDYTITMDRSKDIRMMVADLENNIFSGFVLVIAVVMLFMGFRNSLFVAVAIPLSLLITFGALYAVGLTLNMVVLFSLILALGMLVDNVIVIVENIYRHMQEGMGRVEAAMVATRQVAWPVTTSTVTTVAAFSTLLFWPGIAGEFLGYLPKTVIIVLVSSLFVALVMNPVFCATFMRLKKRHQTGEGVHDGWMARGYGRILKVVLANRGLTIAVALSALVSTGVAFFRWGAGIEFFPDAEPNRCQISIKASEGTKLDVTNDVAVQIERRLLDVPDIDYVSASVGIQGTGGGFLGGGRGENVARVSVEFVDREERTQDSFTTVRQIRDALGDVRGAVIDVEKERHGPPTGKPVEIELSGEKVERMADILPKIYERIRTAPGLVDLKDDLVVSRPERRFDVNRWRASMAGMWTDWVAQFIKMYVRGIKVGDYREGDDQYDITLRADDNVRYDLQKLMNLMVPTPAGGQVPLSSVAEPRLVGGHGNIERVDQKRAVTVKGSAAEGFNANEILADVKGRLADLPLPPGYSIRFRGEDEEQKESMDFLIKAFIGSIILILLVLVSQFNSISMPFIIMLAVLMSLVGVFTGLLVTGLSFGVILTGIGIIGLAGVVVNNGIVLIHYTLHLEKRGLDSGSAIVLACKTRLRPVLLTAITTMLGLLPMAIGVSFDVHEFRWDLNSESSQWWRNMAVSVIFGLGVATTLTLLVEPALYSLLRGARVGWANLKARAQGLEPIPPGAETQPSTLSSPSETGVE